MHFARRILLTAVFGLALPLAASAQSTTAPARLAVGTWTGVVIPPNQEAVNVTYEVAYTADTLAIMLVAGDHGRFALNEIVVGETKLNFSFTPGPKVVCALSLKDTGYAGECTDDDGNVVPMTMVPPAKEAKS
jgi:hypothetical protein